MPDWYAWSVDAVLVVSGVIGLVGDLRERRLYDWMTIPTLVAGLALNFAAAGAGDGIWTIGLVSSLAGMVALGAFFGLFAFVGAMGGGDVKLMAAYGALLGFPGSLGALAFTGIAGGLIAIPVFIARQPPVKRRLAAAGWKSAAEPDFGKTLPYGLAIVFGTWAFRIWISGAPS